MGVAMKCSIALACAAALASPAAPAQHGSEYAGLPPARFWGEGAGVVYFEADVTVKCGNAPKGYVRLACAKRTENGTEIMVLPLPQNYTGRVPYGELVIHEIGHWRGWSRQHEAQ